MCMAIYAALFALLLFYSDYAIESYALSVNTGEEQWMVAAIGWEMLPMLWPVLLLVAVVASWGTVVVGRRLGTKPASSDEGGISA